MTDGRGPAPAGSDSPQQGAPAGSAPRLIEGRAPSSQGGERLLELLKIMARLRGPGGCPWDAEQTHESLAPHLLEETHETLEAIAARDPERLKEELGDVLLQVVFHSEVARGDGHFDIDDVAQDIAAKLVRRHPHVFAEAKVDTAAQVLTNWERIKQQEKGRRSVDSDLPQTLPALARAAKVQRRAAASGFSWRSRKEALEKVREELAEVEGAPSTDVWEEVGDLLFAVVSLSRTVAVDPETALLRAVNKFSERYEAMRSRAQSEGVVLEQLTAEELLARFRSAGA